MLVLRGGHIGGCTDMSERHTQARSIMLPFYTPVIKVIPYLWVVLISLTSKSIYHYRGSHKTEKGDSDIVPEEAYIWGYKPEKCAGIFFI